MEISSKMSLPLKYLIVPVEHPITIAPSICSSATCLKINLTHLMQALHPQTRQRKILLVRLSHNLHFPMYLCNSVNVGGIFTKSVSRLIYLS